MPRVKAALTFAFVCFFFWVPASANSDLSSAYVYNIPYFNDDEVECLALTMYFEARAEGREGMVAVAAVVLNRVRHSEFPSTICAVVREGGETPPCQFSYWCDGKSDRPNNAEAWAAAESLAYEILRRPDDPTDGALFFHANFIPKPWKVHRIRTVQIGRHIFYR